MLRKSKISQTKLGRSWAVLVVMLWAVATASCTRVTERFEDVSAAEREGLFQRGWLPDVLPREAGPIVEIHDLDTNARCSRSELPADSYSRVESSLRQTGFGTYRGKLPAPPFKNCPFTVKVAQRSDVVLSRTSSLEREFAALDKSSGALLFWAVGPE